MNERPEGERIAKYIAQAGICSRREAEKRIAEGRVTLDDAVVTTPATFVREGQVVAVDGQPLSEPERPRLWLYHKPRGLITTHKDPQGRPTVFDAVREALPRVVSVGRLDFNSEGLLLLTTSGELANRLAHPSQGWTRHYRVRVHKTPTAQTIAALARGVQVEGVNYAPVKVEAETAKGANQWLNVTLTEGKNREIRRLFEHFGHPVSRLIRVSFGPFQLGKLPAGQWKEMPGKTLKELLGKSFFQ